MKHAKKPMKNESKKMAHEHEAAAGKKENRSKKHHMDEARGMRKAMRSK